MSFSPFSTAPALEPVANGITERRTPTTFDVRMGKGLGATAIHPNSSAKYKKNFFCFLALKVESQYNSGFSLASSHHCGQQTFDHASLCSLPSV